MLHVNILKKSYWGKRILENVNFVIKEGEMIQILAPSGAGKTTLLKSILGYTRFSGSIKDDKNSRIVYVQQQSTLNEHETVKNAVYFTALMDGGKMSKLQAEEKAERIMRALGIWHLRNSRIKNISGGQMRRVQIAEAMVREADTFLLDEPDTGLDLFSAYRLIKDLSEVAAKEGKKIIVVSHNASSEIMQLYSKILVLAKDSNNRASIAFYDKFEKMYSYFQEYSVLEIMEKIQSENEDGRGMGELYINKYNSNIIMTGNQVPQLAGVVGR